MDPTFLSLTGFNVKIISRLMEFMSKDDYPYLQLEATWIVINMLASTTEQTSEIIAKLDCRVLLKLLKSPSGEIIEHAISGLRNLTDANRPICLRLRSLGIAEFWVTIVNNLGINSIRARWIWTAKNICVLLKAENSAQEAVPPICHLLKQENNPDNLAYELMVIDSLIWKEPNMNKTIYSSGIAPKIIASLKRGESLAFQVCSLNILKGLISGSEEQTKAVLSLPNLFPSLQDVLDHPRRMVKWEACALFSMIVEGNSAQIDQLVDMPRFIYRLVDLCLNDVSSIGNVAQLILDKIAQHEKNFEVLLSNGVLDLAGTKLNSEDPQTLITTLQYIRNLLEKTNLSPKNLDIHTFFERTLDSIERLCNFPDIEVSQEAVKLAELYKR